MLDTLTRFFSMPDSHFMLQWPWLLLLMPLPWLVRRWLRATDIEQQAALYFPPLDTLLDARGDHVTTRTAHEKAPVWLWLLWCLLVLAAARPQWQGEPLGIPTSGRDLLLLVDISGSMETPDMKINGEPAQRVDVVKQVVGDFVRKRSGDRVGLVLFGTRAYLQTPLTFDRNTLAKQLEETQIGFAGEKTSIGDAIALSVKRLQDRSQQSRVIILLTDGANTAGSISPLQGAELAATFGIKIYTVGIGADVMEQRGFFGMRMRVNPSADLDEKTLTAIAQNTGGGYFRARNTEQLQEIYKILDKLEPSAGNEETLRPVTEWFYMPLGIALLLSMLMAGLPLLSPWVNRLRRVKYT
ncbi:MAG TPA: VWA domain-containing protein [Pseudomonadales bacterium]|nr:VWA domain-containing protein [Pseudomonadales bacterium]